MRRIRQTTRPPVAAATAVIPSGSGQGLPFEDVPGSTGVVSRGSEVSAGGAVVLTSVVVSLAH
ncbi:MAG: hypothetical protein ACO3AV_06155, partial [Ilumatobacteraceae bacterium]